MFIIKLILFTKKYRKNFLCFKIHIPSVGPSESDRPALQCKFWLQVFIFCVHSRSYSKW